MRPQGGLSPPRWSPEHSQTQWLWLREALLGTAWKSSCPRPHREERWPQTKLQRAGAAGKQQISAAVALDRTQQSLCEAGLTQKGRTAFAPRGCALPFVLGGTVLIPVWILR